MKKFLALLLVAMLALGLCSTALAADEAVVSWYAFNDVYLTSVRTAMDEAMAAKGITPNNRDANTSQTQQTEDVSTATLTGTNIVVINLVDSGAIGTATTMLNEVKNAGLPVIFFNRSVGSDEEAGALFNSYPEKSAYVGTNQEEAGIMQGAMIGNYVLENYDALDLNGDGIITYVMFKGAEGNQEAIYRTKWGQEGADEILTANGKPALKFYDESNANKYLVDLDGAWSARAAYEYLGNILAQYNEDNGNMVELVIANNDEMALGSIQALQDAGYNTGVEGAKMIPVFGVDATEAAKAAIAAGTMTGTIKQDAVGMADAVATIAANLIAGKDKYEGLNENYKVVDGWFVQIPYAAYTGEE